MLRAPRQCKSTLIFSHQPPVPERQTCSNNCPAINWIRLIWSSCPDTHARCWPQSICIWKMYLYHTYLHAHTQFHWFGTRRRERWDQNSTSVGGGCRLWFRTYCALACQNLIRINMRKEFGYIKKESKYPALLIVPLCLHKQTTNNKTKKSTCKQQFSFWNLFCGPTFPIQLLLSPVFANEDITQSVLIWPRQSRRPHSPIKLSTAASMTSLRNETGMQIVSWNANES